MENECEILITVNRSQDFVCFEFPDGNPVCLPKEPLSLQCEYFRTIFSKEIENQYIVINEFSFTQASALKHLLVCLGNGFKNILPDLPFEDSLKILDFNTLLGLSPDIIQSVTKNFSELDYAKIETIYKKY